MPLAEFLNDGTNTHAREEMFTCRLLYDTKIAAAERGYHLRSYYSDVDHDGFDAILDDADKVVRIQLKTVLSTSTKTRWDDIRKYVLRPTVRNWESFGFDFAVAGVEGAVVLMELTVAGTDVNVHYGFTDIFIIAAIAQGYIVRPANVRTTAQQLLKNIGAGTSSETVAVTKPMFVWASTHDHLLSLLGLQCIHHSNWRGLMLILVNHVFGEADEPMPDGLNVQTLSEQIIEMLETSAGHVDV